MNNSAISFIFDHVDQVGANLVARTYHNLVSHYSSIIYTLTAVYIGFVFIKMMRGHHDANDFLMLVFRAVFILTLALNYEYFCLFIYNVFTSEPLIICKAITINNGSVESSTIASALDNFVNGGKAAAIHVFTMGSWTNPTYLVFGVLIFLFVLISAAIAAGLIVLAKCASTILLALSPIFIFFALFDATKGLFESYIRQLITYALVPIMTCAVLMILLSVADVATNELKNSAQPTIAHLIPLGLMCIIQVYLLLQVKSKCASLSGGFSLPTVISAFRQTKSEWASVGQRVSDMTGSALSGVSSAASVSRSAGAAISQRLARFNKE